MSLYFVTGNQHKFAEAKAIFPQLKQLEIDLPEIQEIDAQKIIKAKLLQALEHKQGQIMVEDTSLYLDCLNGLPGPLTKWFLKTLGNQGLSDLAEKLGNNQAEARTIIGYARNPEEIYFFEGSVKGKVVSPAGRSGFGWDPIFQPDGYAKSFAQLTQAEKNKISMRRTAFNQLKNFLEATNLT